MWRVVGYAFPFLFTGWWLFVTTFVRRSTRLTRTLQIETGPALRESPWGSALINGMRAYGCVKLVEYQDGYVLRMMWVFGDGKLWLPKQRLRVGIFGAAAPRRRRLVSGEHELVLFEELADFVGVTTDGSLVPLGRSGPPVV